MYYSGSVVVYREPNGCCKPILTDFKFDHFGGIHYHLILSTDLSFCGNFFFEFISDITYLNIIVIQHNL